MNSYLYDPQTGNPVAPLDYSSFGSLISDVGESRVYGGVHFQYSIDAANTIGADVANYVVSSEVAVPEPASLGLITIGAIGLLGRHRRKANSHVS